MSAQTISIPYVRPSALPPGIAELETRLPEYCRSHGITRMEVFGSVATGDARPGSDLDLLVTFRRGLQLGLDFFGMQEELGQLLLCEVDLLTRRSVEQDGNAIRRRSILGSAREIYAG